MGLKSSWLKSLGLNLGVEKSGIEMSFKPLVHLNLKIANSLAIFDLKITLVQVSASVSTTYKILFLVTFVVTFCPVMQGALFKINLLHICRKNKIKKS